MSQTPPPPASPPPPPPPAPGSMTTGRQVGKTRNPWGVWLLALVTLGIYGYYWWYRVNQEVRDYDPSIRVDPTLALLAYLFGGILCYVPLIITILNTGSRIQQAQRTAGVDARCSGGLGFLFAILLSTQFVYYQSQLNKVWDQHGNPEPGTAV